MAPYYIDISLEFAMHLGLPEANSCSSGWPPGVWILANTLTLYIFVSKSDINVELYTYRYLLVFTE